MSNQDTSSSVTSSDTSHYPYSNKALFNQLYNSLEQEIPYNEAWANSTGYLDYAPDHVHLLPGQAAKSICPNGRKIVFIGSKTGTIVVFQRYSNSEDTYAAHICKDIQNIMCFSTPLTDSDMYVLLGRASWARDGEAAKAAYGHIGQRLAAYDNLPETP